MTDTVISALHRFRGAPQRACRTWAPREPESAIRADLCELGRTLGFQVYLARSERSEVACAEQGCLAELPGIGSGIYGDVVRSISVLWLHGFSHRIVAAFEVEDAACIGRGVVRLLTLALGPEPHALEGIFVVAPDQLQEDVRHQTSYPAFRPPAGLELRFLAFSELQASHQSLSRAGGGVGALRRIAHLLR